MTEPVCSCDDHGYFEGEKCPHCGAAGTRVLAASRRRRLSKHVSGALRHFPGDAGIELDAGGWTPFSDLTAAVAAKYGWAVEAHLDAVVATDPEGRFERDDRDDGRVVRAAYGHSVDVDLGATDGSVPDALYHGTAPRNMDSIREAGLRPMSRQHVHLSGSVAEAREVGSRHAAEPVILNVDAAAMRADGFDVVERGRSTYTTDRVPPRYLSRRRE